VIVSTPIAHLEHLKTTTCAGASEEYRGEYAYPDDADEESELEEDERELFFDRWPLMLTVSHTRCFSISRMCSIECWCWVASL